MLPSALRQAAFEDLVRATGRGAVVEEQRSWAVHQISYEKDALRRFFRLADRMGLYVPHEKEIRDGINDFFDQRSFISEPLDRKWIPSEYLEIAGLAQHYGVPTRLLDWTYNPFVAAYFASKSGLAGDYISIWCINMEMLNGARFAMNGLPIQFITPYYGGNPNLAAQEGLFTHLESGWPGFQRVVSFLQNGRVELTDRRPLNQILEENPVANPQPVTHNIFRKFKLPKAEAPLLREHLLEFGYGPARLFPGYSGVVRQMLGEL